MTEQTDAIITRLASALAEGSKEYAAALAGYWGEGKVDVRHEPSLPQDAPMDRQAMLAERTLIDRAFSSIMNDFRYEAIYARAVGDIGYLFCEQVGTLADGTAIRAPLCTRITFDTGRVTKVVLNIDLDATAVLMAAFKQQAELAAS